MIAANAPVSVEMARQVAEVFTEVILAPAYDDGAVEVLSAKKNLRILVVEPYRRGGVESRRDRRRDAGPGRRHGRRRPRPGRAGSWWPGSRPADAVLADLEFAWRAVRGVKSNAILLARDGASVGVGMGQVNRVDSCRLAVQRAGDRAAGSVAASDAFFPFADGPEILLEAGVRAIVQPGGSVRDDEVVAAVRAAGATMYFTGARHFFH